MTLDEAINNLSEEEVDLLMNDPQMLEEFKQKFAAHAQPEGLDTAIGSSLKKLVLNPLEKSVSVPMDISKKLGTGVEAGGAGLAHLVPGAIKSAGDILAMNPHKAAQDFPSTNDVMNASQDVNSVLAGLEPSQTGKVGKTIGSFFTPNQIALQAVGEGAAKPIMRGLGAGINKVGEMLAPASETELPGAAKAAGNLLSTVSGVGTPELETVMSNPNAVRAAKTFPQVAEDVAGSMNKMTEHLQNLETAANAALDAKKTMNVSTMADALNAEIKSIKMADVTTPAMENAQEVLEGMLDKIKNKGTMTEPEVAKWVKSVQSKINWNDPLGSDLNEALTHVQSTVNDALKAQNPAYGAATENFANAVNLKNDLSKAMGVSKGSGMRGEFAPENVSVAKLKGLTNPDSAIATKKLLGQFAEVPGVPNYLDIAKQSAAKAVLQQGWRSRLAGVLAGLVPGMGNLAEKGVSGAINAAPAAGNAVYQGLTQ